LRNPLADVVYQMIKGGFLNAVSVGFSPIEWKQTSDKSRPGGIDFSKVELLEISIVPIPALPSALVQARAAGIETRIFADWAANQLTKDSSIISRASLNVISREFRSPPASRGARPFAEAKAANSRSTAGFESLGHYARAVIGASVDNKRIDERLVRAGPSGANEVDPTSGGFLIPDAFSDQLIGSLWEESVIAPLVDRRETAFPENMSLPGVDETNRATAAGRTDCDSASDRIELAVISGCQSLKYSSAASRHTANRTPDKTGICHATVMRIVAARNSFSKRHLGDANPNIT
jgi:hypothetical protein